MKIVRFSEAKKNLKVILDTVSDDADVIIINRYKADDAVIMSLDYYNSLIETVYLLKFSANAAHLATSIEQYRSNSRISD